MGNKMENKDMLNKEQLNSVINTLSKSRNDTDKLYDKISEEVDSRDNSNDPLEEGIAQYNRNGIITGVNDSDDIDFDHFEAVCDNIDAEELINKSIDNNINNNFNLSNEDSLKFANVITRVRNDEKFNIYNELPDQIKLYIDKAIEKESSIPVDQRKLYRNSFASFFINELVSDSEFDAISIDLEKAISELVPYPTEMYSELNKETIELKFPETAEKIKEQDPVRAQNLLDMRQGFIDAYTFEPMYKLLESSKVLNKVRKADRMWNRVNNEYKTIAGKCKFKLYTLDDIVNSLQTLEISNKVAKQIVSLFVYTYINGLDMTKEEDYNNIYKNSFANYFEMNIKNISIIPNLVTDFSKEIKENIIKLSNHVETVVVEREKELLNNKKK